MYATIGSKRCLTLEYTDHAAIFCRIVRYIEKKFLEKKENFQVYEQFLIGDIPHLPVCTVIPAHKAPLDTYFRNNQKISDNTRLARIMVVMGK